MKRVLVVSDTHGRHDNLEKIVQRLKPIDLLLHLGDVQGGEYFVSQIGGCASYIVKGNCDWYETGLMSEYVLPLENHKIFMTHGHRYGVNYGVDTLKMAARERGADIALFGHTHEPYLEQTDDVTVLNPGSLSLPRQTNGKCSYAMIEIDREGALHFTISYL